MNALEKTDSYFAAIEVPGSPSHASTAVSEVNKWWAKNFNGSANRTGDTFTVRFGDTFVDFEVIELKDGKESLWRVTDCNIPWQEDKKEWTGTQVEWLFEPIHDGTKINMTHIGLTPQVDCYETCRKGWDEYVKGSLSEFIKTGHGLPS